MRLLLIAVLFAISYAQTDSVTKEVVACMESDTSSIVSEGVSWLIRSSPGLIEPEGMMYDNRKMAANLWEFQGMFLGILECVKAGSMNPITSGEYKWFAPSGRPQYTIYTQKAGCIEEYGYYKERVEVFKRWIEVADSDGGRYAQCVHKMSSAGKELYLKFMKDAQQLWKKEFGVSAEEVTVGQNNIDYKHDGACSQNESDSGCMTLVFSCYCPVQIGMSTLKSSEVDEALGTEIYGWQLSYIIIFFAIIGASTLIYHGATFVHKRFARSEFQVIETEC